MKTKHPSKSFEDFFKKFKLFKYVYIFLFFFSFLSRSLPTITTDVGIWYHLNNQILLADRQKAGRGGRQEAGGRRQEAGVGGRGRRQGGAMSFCRITGKARDQPKPNFFPIIPPISPADARY